MEEDDKGCPMFRMGVSGWMFLLIPAYPGTAGSPRQKAVKRLCVCVCVCVLLSQPIHLHTASQLSTYCFHHYRIHAMPCHIYIKSITVSELIHRLSLLLPLYQSTSVCISYFSSIFIFLCFMWQIKLTYVSFWVNAEIAHHIVSNVTMDYSNNRSCTRVHRHYCWH